MLRAIDPHHVGVGRAVQTTQNGGARGPPAVFELFKILERGTLPPPPSVAGLRVISHGTFSVHQPVKSTFNFVRVYFNFLFLIASFYLWMDLGNQCDDLIFSFYCSSHRTRHWSGRDRASLP